MPAANSSRYGLFEVLFDHSEPSPFDDSAFAPYGNFGLPLPPPNRPWIYTNFVQTLDGIASLLGKQGSGRFISQSAEDRWLMDLLRAHADGVMMGMNTLLEEQRSRGPNSRGIVFRVVRPEMKSLRQRLGKVRERNIFVTRALDLDLSRFSAFDGDVVEPVIVTSAAGAERLRAHSAAAHVTVIASGEGETVHFRSAIRMLREQLGIKHLLCEGGPALYGTLARQDLIDEKFVTISPLDAGHIVPPEQERLAGELDVPQLRRPTTFEGAGFTHENMTRWTWLSCRKAGDHQFSRYRRKR